MMKIITGSTGTAHVTSNNDGEFNQGIFGSGLVVLANGYHLEAQIKDANTITIKDGDLVFQGRHALIEPGTTEDVTIQTGSVGMNRNDLIVARYELDESTGYEKIILDVITGEESAGEPIDPAYVEGDIRTGALVAEVPLYRVKLSGININEVVPMFNFVPELMGTVNQLKENLEWKQIYDEVGKVAKTIDFSKYNEIALLFVTSDSVRFVAELPARFILTDGLSTYVVCGAYTGSYNAYVHFVANKNTFNDFVIIKNGVDMSSTSRCIIFAR